MVLNSVFLSRSLSLSVGPIITFTLQLKYFECFFKHCGTERWRRRRRKKVKREKMMAKFANYIQICGLSAVCVHYKCDRNNKMGLWWEVRIKTNTIEMRAPREILWNLPKWLSTITRDEKKYKLFHSFLLEPFPTCNMTFPFHISAMNSANMWKKWINSRPQTDVRIDIVCAYCEQFASKKKWIESSSSPPPPPPPAAKATVINKPMFTYNMFLAKYLQCERMCKNK